MIDSPCTLTRRTELIGWRLVRRLILAISFGWVAIQGPTDRAMAEEQPTPGLIESMGIDGHYRVGKWTGIRLASGPDGTTPLTTVQTRDGDGVRVDFDNHANRSNWVYVMPGSEAAPLALIREGAVVQTDRLPTQGAPTLGPAMIAQDMPWVLVFGDPLGIEAIGKNEILGREPTVATSIATAAAELPDSSQGYAAVDLVVITAKGQAVLSQLTPAQQAALTNWMYGGGRVLMMMGKASVEFLEAVPWLKPWLPIEAASTVKMNPSAIETFTQTQVPLDDFYGLRLPRNMGQTLISGRTTRRVSTPIAVEYRRGFGSLVVLSADLHQAPFVDWPERLTLITSLAGSLLDNKDRKETAQSPATAYNDLAGQFRSSLDQFEIKKSPGFSVIALVLMGLIVAIGPLDYLLVNRLMGRPIFGWLSFPVIAIGLSAVLTFQARPVKPPVDQADAGPPVPARKTTLQSTTLQSTTQCNRVELIDIDTISHRGRGQSFHFLYTHHADLFDLGFRVSRDFESIAPSIRHRAAPFGFPGISFGGIQISVEDTRFPSYVTHQQTSTSDESVELISQLPLAPRSSKGFVHEFEFETDLASDLTVGRRPGGDQLRGSLTNPLPCDLLDGVVIFRNWMYFLPSRFPAGDQIAALEDLKQKNFRWRLSRTTAIESSSKSEAWDPASKTELSRLIEMLMFHDAVGGTRYTRLEDGPLKYLDLTSSLTQHQCIVMGRIELPWTEVEVSGSGDDESFVPTGKRISMVRVILPVVLTK